MPCQGQVRHSCLRRIDRLGRVELTEAERASLDLNDDGLLDVADLVFFLKDIGSPTPIASFENMSTVALEGVRAVSVSVAFTNTFHGTLRYTVSGGTATAGADYAASTGTLDVAGAAVEIPITLLDDTEVEETETLTVRLELGDGYAIQEPVEHTIFINDNDGVWTGTYDLAGTRMSFELTLIRSGDISSGNLVWGESSFLPEGEWAAEVTIEPNSFRAEIHGIPVPAEATALAVPLTRSFVLEATAGAANVILDWDSVLVGVVTENIAPDDPGMQYMDRSTQGVFVLTRPGGTLSVPEPPLETAP